MGSRSVTWIARLAVVAAVCLTGCATVRGLEARDTEKLLAAAGFKPQPIAANTDLVDATPPYRLVSRLKDGNLQYSFADPARCRCRYVGGWSEYAEYGRLVTERRLDEKRWRAAEDVWDRNSWGVDF